MLSVNLDREKGIAILEPQGRLLESDFKTAARIIDPYIAKRGALKGLIISTREFPGWDSFAALASHIKFVKDHHKKLSRVAVVTDSMLGDFAETIAAHFVSAEIKHFPYGQFDKAMNWILGN